jgi:ATP-dependent Clp protease ATP-binding subunit ClpB
MRQDKLTTKFQEALSDAQTLALGNDNGYIEPVHLLEAMLRQEDGPRALLEKAGVNVNRLTLPRCRIAQIQRGPPRCCPAGAGV